MPQNEDHPKQADASGRIDEPEAATGRFDCLNDLFDLADRSCEESNRMLAACDLRVVEPYQEGRMCLAIEVCIRRDARKWHLICSAIKDGIKRGYLSGANRMVNPNIPAFNIDRDKFCMNRMAQFIEGPKGVIPSLVWLESADKRHDGVGNILADLSPANKVVEIIGAGCDGKLSMPQTSVTGDLARGIAGLIESGSSCDQRVGSRVNPRLWEGFGESEFESLCATIRVKLCDVGGWMFVTVPPDCGIEIGDMIFCAQETAFSAIEGVILRDGHDGLEKK